jgi:IS5 family transposase
MRETRNAQTSLFDFYAEHELGHQLRSLSELLDEHPEILMLIEQDLFVPETTCTGASGLSVESVFRCLLLKQILQVSYEKLAFHLCDSPTYRAFTRLTSEQMPSRSGLQSTIRQITPETLEKVNKVLIGDWVEHGVLSVESLRIDSTVVLSNIHDPSDSQLLNDGIRVLSRLMATCKDGLGIRLRFTDQRKRSKSLTFRIFNAKQAEKQVLYPDLLSCTGIVIKQARRAIDAVRLQSDDAEAAQRWVEKVEHYLGLLLGVVDQTQRRVYNEEKVPASEKIVSLFEEHTDVIVKGDREVLYGHKINLATQENGFITYLNIEDGNPAECTLYLPVLTASDEDYSQIPINVVADGCYVSNENVKSAKELGAKRTVFNKPAGLSYNAMGVKKKTFKLWKNFRAGVEGNISELKRAFGAGKAMWKYKDGFDAFVWSSTLCYNLIKRVRLWSA